MRRLCFTSSKFQPLPGEQEKTNPGVFGQALARWVRETLNANGHTIREEPFPEDWGWVVMIQKKPFKLWVGCGNEIGNSTQWSVFVVGEPSLFQKLLKRKNVSSRITAMEQELERIIKAEAECANVVWESV